jgi:hypothetical protein
MRGQMDLYVGTFHDPDSKPNVLFRDVFQNDGSGKFTNISQSNNVLILNNGKGGCWSARQTADAMCRARTSARRSYRPRCVGNVG